VEHSGLLLGVLTFTLASTLVILALLEIRLPAHVVDVQHRAIGIEVEHLVHHGLDQLHIV
jgi:hypothetical protein